MTLVADWARFFALTLGIELLVAVPLLDRSERFWRRAVAVTLGQLLTHPGVWFILPELRLGRLKYLVVAETGAVVLELLFYKLVFQKLPWSRALAASTLANGASLAMGSLLS